MKLIQTSLWIATKQIKSNQIESNRIKSNQIKSNQIKSNQIKSNQIKSIYLSWIARGVVAQSPEPGAHVLNVRAFRIELEFRSVGLWGEGKTGEPREKPLGAEKRTNNKLSPHMTSNPGIEPWPHWCFTRHHIPAPAPPSGACWRCPRGVLWGFYLIKRYVCLSVASEISTQHL